MHSSGENSRKRKGDSDKRGEYRRFDQISSLLHVKSSFSDIKTQNSLQQDKFLAMAMVASAQRFAMKLSAGMRREGRRKLPSYLGRKRSCEG